MVKRILHVVPNMNMGGLETFIMNVYRNINRDEFQFDFLEHYKEESYYDKEINELGGNIYHFDFRNNNNILRYIKNLNKFFKEHKEYEIIHCHMESIGALVFIIAKINGIKIRIGHAHTDFTSNDLKGIIKRFTSMFFKYTTTMNLACSNEAGRYLFGKKEFEVINNGIDIDKFEFNRTVRDNLRKEYNIDNKFVIGHIGRMDEGKNQKFLIEVFSKYLKINKEAVLVLVGDGKQKEELVKMIKKLKIEDKVLLLGVKGNANELYSMFDLFAFPSLYEGLGIVLIEAQINGVKTFTSKFVPRSTKISNMISYLKLDVDSWVKEICDVKKRDIVIYNDNMLEYDIKNVTNKLVRLYNRR